MSFRVLQDGDRDIALDRSRYFTGVIALSNSTYSKPWQKVNHGRVIFSNIVNQYNSVSKRDELKARLFAFLCSTEKYVPSFLQIIFVSFDTGNFCFIVFITATVNRLIPYRRTWFKLVAFMNN